MLTAMGMTGLDLPLCKALSLRYVTGCQSELMKTSVCRPVSPSNPHHTEVSMSYIKNANQGDFFGLSWHDKHVCTLALM